MHQSKTRLGQQGEAPSSSTSFYNRQGSFSLEEEPPKVQPTSTETLLQTAGIFMNSSDSVEVLGNSPPNS